MRLDDRWYVMAWIEIWHELPGLFGRSWRDAFPWVMEILGARRTSSLQDERRRLVRRLVIAVHPHARVRDRLREVVDRHRRERTDVDPGPAAPPLESLQAGVASCLAPPVVERRVEIRAPRFLAVGREMQVTIALPAVEASTASLAEQRTLRLDAKLEIEVSLHVTPGLLKVISEPAQTTYVQDPAEDPPSVCFTVRGLAPGTGGQLVVDVRQMGLFLGSFRAPIEVVGEAAVPPETVLMPARLDTGGPCHLAADLDLRVLLWTRQGRDMLEFVLHSGNLSAPFFHQSIEGPELKTPGEAYQRGLIERMDALRAEPENFLGLQSLETEGCILFRELFPPALQALYRTIDSSVQSFQIISDEPWFPWELIRCSRREEGEEFLCERFFCARWLAGTTVPVQEIRIRGFACVATGEASNGRSLGYPEYDKAWIQGLAAALELRDHSPEPVTAEAIQRLHAAGEVDLWHFAAPGLSSLDQPGETGILLPDGRRFAARDLIPGRRATDGRRPLVFLNVSQSARQGWWLTRLSGWVQAWVTDARCGALVAPLWNVNDSLAHLFAATFYEALREKASLGEAMARARLRVRAEAPGDPTWIAYQLYASPNTVVRWDAAPRGAE